MRSRSRSRAGSDWQNAHKIQPIWIDLTAVAILDHGDITTGQHLPRSSPSVPVPPPAPPPYPSGADRQMPDSLISLRLIQHVLQCFWSITAPPLEKYSCRTCYPVRKTPIGDVAGIAAARMLAWHPCQSSRRFQKLIRPASAGLVLGGVMPAAFIVAVL
jgi:hypothetical protein